MAVFFLFEVAGDYDDQPLKVDVPVEGGEDFGGLEGGDFGFQGGVVLEQ